MAAPFDPALIADDFKAREIPDLDALAKQVDLSQALTATGYGAKEQRGLGEVSAYLLNRTDNKAMDRALAAIKALLSQIEEINIASLSEPRGIFAGLFSKNGRRFSALKKDYPRISQLVDRLAGELDMAQLMLQKENSLLQQMYDSNKATYHALDVKIAAGERAVALQQAGENMEFLDLFMNRLSQLKTSKALGLQTGVQIRLTQHNISLVSDKLKETMDVLLPLWQNQLALAMSLQKSQEAFRTTKDTAKSVQASSVQTGEDLASLKEADRRAGRL